MEKDKIFIEPLGTIKINKIYLFYDGPQIMSCSNDIGHKFFCMNLDSHKDGELWYFVPVSQERLRNIECDKITLFAALTTPEIGFLYEVKLYYEDKASLVRHITPDLLKLSILPEKDAFLETDIDISCQDDCDQIEKRRNMLVIANNIQVESNYLNRDILDISLEPNGSHMHEISVDSLGLTLYRIQSLVKAQGTSALNINNYRKRKKYEDLFLMNATGFFAASFGVRLVAKHPAGMFGQSRMYNALNTVLDLLDKPSNKINDLMKNLDYRTISSYRFLLKILKKSKISMQAVWSSPNKETRHSRLSLDDVDSALTILEKEESNFVGKLTLIGKLVAIDSERRTFKFRDSEDEIYSGNLSENLGSVFHVSRDEQVQVELEETIELNPTTQEENFIYTLISLNYDYNDIEKKKSLNESEDNNSQ